MSQRHDALGAKEDSPHRLYLPLREILRRDQILDLTGTLTGEPRGAPLGRVLSYSCACTWGSTEVPLGDAQSERHRPSCGRFQNPWASVRSALVTLLHALGYRDTLVASLLVVVARPRRLVESTRFDLSESFILAA